MSTAGPPIGLVLGSALPPEEIQEVAARAERLGFGQFWLAEDYFFTGGISGAAGALAATERASVGLGVVSAMVRHPAVLAMELSTLARMYPGRVMPGLGLGLPPWVRQMGLYPRSSLGAMREAVTAVRALLEGEELTADGDYFSFDKVKLTYPVPDAMPPIAMGVVGPKMLQLSGEIAGGTVLSVLAGDEYIRWAREEIAVGAQRAGRDGRHRISTFALFSVDEDGDRAREQIRGLFAFYLHAMAGSAILRGGLNDRVLPLAAGGPEALARAMPGDWLEDLAVAGDPAECAEKIDRLLAAGSDTVELFVVPPERVREIVDLAAREVLPRVTGRAAP